MISISETKGISRISSENLGISGVEASVDDHRLIQPNERVLVSTEACGLAQRGQLIPFLLPGKLTGDSVKDSINFFLIPGGELGDVVTIQPQDTAFGFIRRRRPQRDI